MAVPYTFGTATSSIPLSQLDSNFNTVITLGNTAIQLGNTVTTLNNMTLANVTISSGNVTITNVAITTANVTTANITTAVIGTETVTTSTITTANVTTANITTDNITNGTVITSLTLSYGTANGVAYLNGSKVLTTGSALTFDGTIFSLSPTGAQSTSRVLASAGQAATLQVGGNANAGGTTSLDVVQDSANNGYLFQRANAPLIFGTNNAERMRIDSSGNLGLGVTPSVNSIAKAFELQSGFNIFGYANLGYINANTYFNGNWLYKDTAAAGRYEVGDNHKWFIAPSGTAGTAISFTQAMTLDSSGNLLVGTTAQIDSGSICLVKSGATSNGIIIKDTNAGGGNQIKFLNSSGTSVGYINQNGTATTYNVTSDERLKENIQDSDSASSLIDAIQVRKYNWKENGTYQRYGFIAQELVTVAPEAVHQPVDPEEMMAVDYSKLVPMLVKEIQSLRKRLADAGIA